MATLALGGGSLVGKMEKEQIFEVQSLETSEKTCRSLDERDP